MSQPSGLASASNPTSSGGLEMRCEPGNRQLELLRAQDGNQVEIHSNVFGKQTSTMMSGTVRLMARSIRELLLSFPTEKQPDAKKFIESELRRILDADGKETTGQHQSSGFGEVSSPTLSESSGTYFFTLEAYTTEWNMKRKRDSYATHSSLKSLTCYAVSRDLHPGTSSLELSRYLGSPNRTIVQAKDDPSTFGWENQARYALLLAYHHVYAPNNDTARTSVARRCQKIRCFVTWKDVVLNLRESIAEAIMEGIKGHSMVDILEERRIIHVKNLDAKRFSDDKTPV